MPLAPDLARVGQPSAVLAGRALQRTRADDVLERLDLARDRRDRISNASGARTKLLDMIPRYVLRDTWMD